jgi:hypothetical protein
MADLVKQKKIVIQQEKKCFINNIYLKSQMYQGQSALRSETSSANLTFYLGLCNFGYVR